MFRLEKDLRNASDRHVAELTDLDNPTKKYTDPKEMVSKVAVTHFKGLFNSGAGVRQSGNQASSGQSVAQAFPKLSEKIRRQNKL